MIRSVWGFQGSSQAAADNATGSAVWGTSISVQASTDRFAKFWKEFKDPHTGEPLYPRLLHEAVSGGALNINLNCKNLRDFDPALCKELIM